MRAPLAAWGGSEDAEEDRHQSTEGGLSVSQRRGDLSALSWLNAYCNYEDVMDVLLETTGRHSCSLEKDMGLQSPVYNLRILSVLKESQVWGDGVDITLDKVFIVFPTLLA